MSDQEEFLEEEQIFFKRFPAEKQEQVRGLVQYATLMGLSGKDLVSIGGKLDRLKAVEERKRNVQIIEGFECLLIGADVKLGIRSREQALNERFKLKTPHGNYNFQYDYGKFTITSLKTKAKRSHSYTSPYDYNFPQSWAWAKRSRCALLLDIYHGKLQLNF